MDKSISELVAPEDGLSSGKKGPKQAKWKIMELFEPTFKTRSSPGPPWIAVLSLVVLACLLALERLHTYSEPLERDICTYAVVAHEWLARSEEHTSELQSLRHLVCR